MTIPGERDARPEERAERLLRWYPRAWRSRYGEEFAELLIADLAERPRAWSRTADVIRGGITARLADAGLGGALPPATAAPPAASAQEAAAQEAAAQEAAAQEAAALAARRVRASLASLACCAAVFLGFGTAMWSQLTIGWQWSAPHTPGTAVATCVMSGAMLAFAVLALLAALPTAWTVAERVARGHDKTLLAPSILGLAALAVVIAGGRHFGNGWPGTGGHPWPHRGLVPGGVAAFAWASTLSVSSFWAHPAALAAFPPAELTWMAASPLALAGLVTGAVMVVRRTEFRPSAVRFQTRLAGAACAIMAVFLGGACAWVTDRAAAPGSLFHAGAIDVAGLAVMALALAVARQAARRPAAGPDGDGHR